MRASRQQELELWGCRYERRGCSVLLPPRLCWQDYELQLMTYRAFVESQQKSPMKRRRMLSSSDAITQEVGTCLSLMWGSGGGWGVLPLHPTARRPL